MASLSLQFALPVPSSGSPFSDPRSLVKNVRRVHSRGQASRWIHETTGGGRSFRGDDSEVMFAALQCLFTNIIKVHLYLAEHVAMTSVNRKQDLWKHVNRVYAASMKVKLSCEQLCEDLQAS